MVVVLAKKLRATVSAKKKMVVDLELERDG